MAEIRPPNSQQWNIFARELSAVLQHHGFRLGQLNDRAHLHPQQVSRLQRSLDRLQFPVLSPEQLAEVVASFDLTNDEVIRLRAATLATAVQRVLMDRIPPKDALAAADQIFLLLHDVLRRNDDDSSAIGLIKGRPSLMAG